MIGDAPKYLISLMIIRADCWITKCVGDACCTGHTSAGYCCPLYPPSPEQQCASPTILRYASPSASHCTATCGCPGLTSPSWLHHSVWGLCGLHCVTPYSQARARSGSCREEEHGDLQLEWGVGVVAGWEPGAPD